MVKKEITIKEGANGKKTYTFHRKYESWEEALKEGKEIKQKTKQKYFIIEKTDSWFLPIKEYELYIRKKW